MGCLTAIFQLIFEMMYTAIMGLLYIVSFLFIIIKHIVKKIIQANKNKKNKANNSRYTQPQYQKVSTNINTTKTKQEVSNKKNITNSYSYLKIYINKKYTGLRKNNELNYQMLGIESFDAPIVYYDDCAEVKGYNVFESDECSSEKYGLVLQKIYEHCGNDFYATIGYDQEQVDYKITIKDNKIYINGNNIQFMENRYMYLKNKIITFSEKLYEYFIYIEDDNYYNDVVPNDDLDCDSIESLGNKLKENNDILLFEIPYMEEISLIIDIIEPKIIKEYQKGQDKVFNSLPDIEVIDEYEEEPIFEFGKKENKKKEMSWKEKEFEREADLWGLSEEDRRIAKEERMSPAEFIEAEEYDDDELLLDEWER